VVECEGGHGDRLEQVIRWGAVIVAGVVQVGPGLVERDAGVEEFDLQVTEDLVLG
jgi:hypothetical protein